MRRAHMHLWKAVQLCLASCVLLTGISSAGNEAKPLQLILYTPLDVDGSATTASTTLRLYNPNPAPLKYSLAIQNAIAKNTKKDAGWVVSFYGADSKPAGPVLEGTVAAHASIQVRADLSHVVEAGETTAALECNNIKIAELKLVKNHGLPFRISLQGNPAEKPEIEFVKGKSVDLRWKNDDSMHYPLSWEIFLKGTTNSGITEIGPNGSTKFTVSPNDDWFSLYQSFFKSETVDGTVTVGYQPKGAAGAYPSKTIPIKARLTYLDPAVRDVVAMFAIFIILALGGFASSYVNVDLVNRVKAILIKKRIGQLARVIGEIGPQLNSQLRVSLWLERGRIVATLPHRRLFTPETGAALSQSDAETEALKGRVDLAVQISDATLRLNHANGPNGLAPTLAEQVTKDLLAGQDLLKKSVLSVGELQKVQSLVGGASNTLDRIGQPDAELEKVIAARLADLNATFTSAILWTGTCAQIRARAPSPFIGLTSAGGSLPRSQGVCDANTRKLAVIADMVQIDSADPGILDCLGRADFDSVFEAEQLLTELKECVSLDDLKEAIRQNHVYVKLDRDTVRVNTPFLMKLMFHTWRFNRASAKQRIEITWNFGHDNFTEKGWDIYHYFPEVAGYTISAELRDINQVQIVPAQKIERTIKVLAARVEGYDHNWVAIQRWAVGFFVALVGLSAGAKEKIFSLDTAGAIFALFLLGFGVDMAKNLLVQK